jgi:MYXO-CTERM domain-containing protein
MKRTHTWLRAGLSALSLFVLLLALTSTAWAVDYGGEDVFIFTDTVWTGEHVNIRKLTIDANATIYAEPGAPLSIQADTVEIRGALSADLTGFPGGNPGGRGRGGLPGQGTGAGTPGQDGSVCGRPGVDYNAGGGGAGGASYFGLAGAGGAGADANDGGCQGAQGGNAGANSNNPSDFHLGAGGGGGGGAGGARNQPGTAGERGGGFLFIETKTLRLDGRISANGGRGGNGGTSPDFFHGGGGGGGGSGGAIVIRTTYMLGSGSLEAVGGQGGNGGSGDRVGNNLYTGAGGGGGGGGLISVQYSSLVGFDFDAQCNAVGGLAGAGSNTNGNAGLPGASGLCARAQVNGAPTADPGGPYRTLEGQPVVLSAGRSFDPDGDSLGYNWDCDGDGLSEATGAEVTCTFPENGVYTVGLIVTDGEGARDVTSAQVFVTEAAPLAVLQAQERINEGDTLSLDASGSTGFADAIVTYAWDLNYDGTFQADQTTEAATLETRFCDNGAFTVAVQVTDDDGSTALALHRLIVTNVNPQITSQPTVTAIEGQPYSYQLAVTDPSCTNERAAADVLTYQITAGPDGMTVNQQGLVTFQPTFRQALEGSTRIRVRVSDDDAGFTAQEWELEVTFADSDGDQLPDTWEVFYDLDPSNPDDAADDGDGDGRDNLTEFGADTSPTEFDGPSRPRLSAPRDGAEASALNPTLTSFRAQSPLQDALTYEFELYEYVEDDAQLNGELLILSSEGISPDAPATVSWEVPLEAGLADETDYCWRVRARDSRVPGMWSELWCFFVNLDNNPPTAPVPLLPENDSQLGQDQPTLVVTNATDPDGDPLTYTFILYQGAQIASPVASVSNHPEGEDGMTQWQVDAPLTENERYCWRVQARDNEGQTSPYTNFSCFTVNLGNDSPSPPVILAPVAPPGEERATETQTPVSVVIRNSEDPEGDDLSYLFELDTSIQFNSPDLVEAELAGDPGDATTWTPQVEGQWKDNTIYYIRVRATDGVSSSLPAVGEFFLNFNNDAPTAPTLRSPTGNLLITSRQPVLTLVNAQDPDGDALKYRFEVAADRDFALVLEGSPDVPETPEVSQYRLLTVQLDNGTYYWRAKAKDAGAEGPWSEVGSFVVQRGDAVIPDPDDGDNNGGGGNSAGSTDDSCGCATPAAPARRPWWTLALASLALGALLLRRR